MRLRFRGGTGGRASREGGVGDAPRELELADLLPVICLLGVIAAVAWLCTHFLVDQTVEPVNFKSPRLSHVYTPEAQARSLPDLTPQPKPLDTMGLSMADIARANEFPEGLARTAFLEGLRHSHAAAAATDDAAAATPTAAWASPASHHGKHHDEHHHSKPVEPLPGDAYGDTMDRQAPKQPRRAPHTDDEHEGGARRPSDSGQKHAKQRGGTFTSADPGPAEVSLPTTAEPMDEHAAERWGAHEPGGTSESANGTRREHHGSGTDDHHHKDKEEHHHRRSASLRVCEEYEREDESTKVSTKRWIFKNQDHDMDYSHMAMISRLPPSAAFEWIVVWQAAKVVEGAHDQQLMMAYSRDGRRWGEAKRVPISPKPTVRWSPVLYYDEGLDPRGAGRRERNKDREPRAPRTYLFYSESGTCLRGSDNPFGVKRFAPGGDIKMIYTLDGATWTDPVTIYTQDAHGHIPKVIANQLVVHPTSGYWILPYWNERPKQEVCKTSLSIKASAGALVSPDRGVTWTPHGNMFNQHSWLIEGTVALLASGDVYQLFRTTTGALFSSKSKDGGKTWEVAKRTTIQNPDSKVNLINLHSTGHHLALAFNDNALWIPGSKPKQQRFDRGRSRLRVALSHNDGGNWTRIALLEPGDNRHYFHYPTLVQDGCRLLVVYSVMQARPAQQMKHGVGGIRIAEVGLKGHVDCSCTGEPLEHAHTVDEAGSKAVSHLGK